MPFSDYFATTALNTTIGEGIYIGPNMARDDVREALQQLAADGKVLSNEIETLGDDVLAEAEAAAELAGIAAATAPNVYASTALGLAAAGPNATFWTYSSGFIRLYRNVSGTAVLLDSLPLSTAVLAHRSFGDATTKAIDTLLNGLPVLTGGPVFIGFTGSEGDAFTVDSGGNFPPGTAYRRYLGTTSALTAPTAGTQLGYADYRSYSTSLEQFVNCASHDVIIDTGVAFSDGQVPPTRHRWYSANPTDGMVLGMELGPNGTLEIGSHVGTGEDAEYYSPSAFGNMKLFVNQVANDWASTVANQAPTGAGFGHRVHTKDETSASYIFGGTSGAGSGTFKFSVRGDGSVRDVTSYYVGADKVLGARKTGWTVDTGTAKRTGNATYAPGATLTYGATYVQAEHTATATRLALIEAALRDATQTIKALKDDLHSDAGHGAIGA